MKPTHLSLAIMIALGVVACGGSDNNTTNPPADPQAQNPTPAPAPDSPQPQPEAKTDDKIVDPTGTKVVDGRDLTKESTVGGLQYIRREASEYDRIYNPTKPASATPLLGVSLDEQNPSLTNIVLARRDLERKDDEAVRAQFAGGLDTDPLTAEGKPQETPALQTENFKNVDILAGAYKQVGSAVFADANNRLDPVTHNIDTHIQNNTDKDREFTRERVSHVYTLRYEYRQPHVDYPHSTDPTLLTTHPTATEPYPKATAADQTHASLTPPAAPFTNNLAGLTAELKTNPTSTFTRTNQHAVNNGLGDGPKSDGYIVNNEAKYGSLDGATGDANRANDDAAPADAWKNLNADSETVNWKETNYPQNYWGRGGYPRYPMQNLEYPHYKGAAQPRYPNVPYNEATRRQFSHTRNNQYTHDHTYLEQEEFTAIRVGQAVRPLRNPKANTWEWTLNQVWSYTQYDASGTPSQRQAQQYGGTGTECGNTQVNCTANWKLETDPSITSGNPLLTTNAQYTRWTWQNLGGGETGAFRGPHYYGWQEFARTIRYNDERIWKPGTPGYRPEYERKYGANLIWWSTPDSAFENWATLEGWDPRARRVDINTNDNPLNPGGKRGEGQEDLVWANGTNNGKNARDGDLEIQPTGDITNGLIRVGGGRPTLGEEVQWKDGAWQDHHKTTTRIFGHYHLAWRDTDKDQTRPMSMNSYLGARSFVAQVKGTLAAPYYVQGNQRFTYDLDSEPELYSIGAEPMTLQKVQYGRVTTQLDLDHGEGPFGDGFLRAPFAKKGTADSVDNYFFRGIDATGVNDMPKEGKATYYGHALMYGINNDFHNITGDIHTPEPKKNLPNAFDGTINRTVGNATLGLGNFVEADVDFATRKVKGDVYNAWLVDTTKRDVVHDKLVSFEGEITGNTVLGTADRTYAPGNDEADFRAAFFGKEAEEMGGSFNSVKPDDKYGSAYETGDWGGVFGAKKLGSGNTFQGDDGTNAYSTVNTNGN